MRGKGLFSKSMAAYGVTLILSGLATAACGPEVRSASQVHTTTLRNEIRVLHIEFAGSENLSLFTFVPHGLLHDEPGRTQWAHVLEHLILNSTGPVDYQIVNAETSLDHMRLDYYGTRTDWLEGLEKHAAWLEGRAFTEAVLAQEKPRIQAEGINVAERLFTHKFAAAAWGQGYRHGAEHAAINGDVESAALVDIEPYRDRYIAPLDQVLVCTVGGLSFDDVLPELEKHLGAITNGARPARAEVVHPGRHDMTWDLDARHLLATWPTVDPSHTDYPALMAAAQWLNAGQWTNGTGEHEIGRIQAGVDCATPEGHHFYVSAALRPGVDFDAAVGVIDSLIDGLSDTSGGGHVSGSKIARMLSLQLNPPPHPRTIAQQVPPGMAPALIEANLGLPYATSVYRLRSAHSGVASALAKLTDADIARVAETYLTDVNRIFCTLRPAPPN
jgi:predicted Zn-dependent peptidase